MHTSFLALFCGVSTRLAARSGRPLAALLLALACAEPALAAGGWPPLRSLWEWLGLPGLLDW
jgi:hypothetical protein